MRLFHIADVHLERSFGWLGRQRGDRRREELRRTFSAAIDLAASLEVDALCIAGDLYETEKAGQATGEFLQASFDRLAMPVLIAPGNHDPFSPGCLYDRLTWPENVHIFRGATLESVRVGDGQIWGRAFQATEDRVAPLADFHTPEDGLHLGLLHADIVEAGATSPYAPLDVRQIASSGLKHLMLGHIHAGRVDDVMGYAYTGSMEPLDLGETGEHWGLLVQAGPSGVVIQRRPLARRQVISDQIDVSDIALLGQFHQIVEAKRERWQGNNVHLRITGTLCGELLLRPDAINEALAHFDLELEVAARPMIDFEILALQQTTLGAFVRTVRRRIDGASNEGERRRAEDILAAGVAAFSGQEVFLG